jgi:predicted nuclease of predicted toxin-antitoxin system
MARFLCDEDFDATIGAALRVRGHDVLRHQEDPAAPRGEPDAEVLARALAAERILLTHNRTDFIRLHRAGARHAGILTLPQDPDAEGAADRIEALLATHPRLKDRLFRVHRPPVGPVEDLRG